MKYKFIDCNGFVIDKFDDNSLKWELDKNYKEWLKGSGDAAIEAFNIELILIKLEKGIFIMQISDYSSSNF